VTAMTELVTTARREGTGELLLTSSLIVLYMSLRGTARALGALESAVMR
jgi:hypothetical protein